MPHQEILTVGLKHFLVLSSILFAVGSFVVVSRRNAVGILIGVELILNSANINLIAFSHYVTGLVGGQVFALFVIVIAAAEAAIALAIVLSIYQNFGTIDSTQADTMRG
ncbi:MAG: NADH-quinone oxidoreductase subunit NuoK [Myxococcota bacterium]|nr:NADH-quinone oxidoreductase subunit NuoK [Myxococcota bacterium]